MSSHRHRQSHFGQYVLSFLLSIMIFVLSLSVCAKVYILDPSTFSDMFTSEDYVVALRNDIVTYAKDECKKCTVPEDFVEDAISYDLVYNIESSFINNALGTSNAYSSNAFEEYITQLYDTLVEAVDGELAAQGIKSSVKDGSANFAKSIADYASERAQFKYTDKLQTLFNLSKVLITVIIVASLVAIGFLMVFLFLGRTKRYRSLRNICHSFEAAALLDFVMVLAVAVVRSMKDLVIYPTYLCTVFMDYINKSMATVFISGLILAFVSIIIMVVIWRIKRGNN